MDNIYKKLFAIQNEQKTFKKSEENPFFKSKYLPLDELQKGLAPFLEKYNVLVYHYTKNNVVITEAKDIESDTSISSEFPIKPELEPQKIGSAISYAKRYNLGEIFNIITDEDDDGNKSSAKTGTDFSKMKNPYRKKVVEPPVINTDEEEPFIS